MELDYSPALIVLMIFGVGIIHVLGQVIATWWSPNWWIVAVSIATLVVGAVALFLWLHLVLGLRLKLFPEKD